MGRPIRVQVVDEFQGLRVFTVRPPDRNVDIYMAKDGTLVATGKEHTHHVAEIAEGKGMKRLSLQ